MPASLAKYEYIHNMTLWGQNLPNLLVSDTKNTPASKHHAISWRCTQGDKMQGQLHALEEESLPLLYGPQSDSDLCSAGNQITLTSTN